MIRLSNISKKHQGVLVLDGLNVSVARGDFVMVMGANGAGKTTLFQLISGHQTPDSGSIFMHEKEITKLDSYARAGSIGRLAQNPSDNVVSDMTVEENLALALTVKKRVSFDAALSLVTRSIYNSIEKEYGIDLWAMKDLAMNRLSGGQRQLIAFIMMTLHKPELLLLDEPTAALDPQAATILLAAVVKFIKEHQVTALLITHDPAMGKALGNRLWLVKNQRVEEYSGDEKRMLTPEALVGSIDFEQLQL